MNRPAPALPAAAALLAIALAAGPARAYCPSYTASSASNQYGCAIEAVPGDNPTIDEWNDIFALVSQGPAVWGSAGPTVPDIGQGCGLPEPLHSVPARFPCELLKGIAMQESAWTQFCIPDSPPDQVGKSSRTIISFDCGYGIGQVTSGMHVGENPSFDRDRVAADPTYNLATGTGILASKWKGTECVGDNQPSVIEDWYIATWAYNGLAYVNNPNNPNYSPGRGVWNPQIGGAAPYQEKVFGWIEHTGGRWTPTELSYPNPGDCGGSAAPPQLPEPSCASPTDCVNTRTIHATACNGGSGGAGGGQGAGGGTPGVGAGAVSSGTAAGGGPDGIGGNGDDSGELMGNCSCRLPGAAGAAGAAGDDQDGGGPWSLAWIVALGLAARARRPRTI